MSVNKLEMSLDDIIKANKNVEKSSRSLKNGKRVRKNFNFKKSGQKAGRGIQKRGNINMQTRRQTNNKRRQQKSGPKNPKNNNVKATTVATKKLVQRLVKKALAQSNITTENIRPINSKRGGVRLVKKTMVLNRLNKRSRMINRTRNNVSIVRQTPIRQIRQVPIRQIKPVQVRRQILFNTLPASSAIQYSPVNLQRNFLRRQRKIQCIQPVIVQEQVKIKQRNPPVYQLVQIPNRNNSVRSQIKSMRRNVVYVNSQQNRRPQQQNRRPQQQNRRLQQQNRRPQQQNRRLQQQNRRLQQQNRRQQNPFYEPQNFLQRVPANTSHNF